VRILWKAKLNQFFDTGSVGFEFKELGYHCV